MTESAIKAPTVTIDDKVIYDPLGQKTFLTGTTSFPAGTVLKAHIAIVSGNTSFPSFRADADTLIVVEANSKWKLLAPKDLGTPQNLFPAFVELKVRTHLVGTWAGARCEGTLTGNRTAGS